MVVKNIIQIGNSILRQRAKSVKDISSKEIQEVIRNLIDTMRDSGLVGMAAPQIGKSLRIFVSEVRDTKYRRVGKEDALKVYINPEIIDCFGEQIVGYEGCGSVIHAQLFGPVKRYRFVTVKAIDESGKEFTLKAKDFLARIIQHEYDHLEGILFTDKLDDWKKIMSREEYLKMKSGKNN